MGRYTNQPTLAIDFLKPSRAEFSVPGAAVDSGRNGVGQSISVEFSGGGVVRCTYADCFTYDSEAHEYLTWLSARLDGGFRFINVPIKTDWQGPFPVDVRGRPQPIIKGIPHSDGAFFSDGSGYSQAAVWGKFTAPAALNAGVISIRVYGAARRLRWSDWLSTYHDDAEAVVGKGWRAYRYWDVMDVSETTEVVEGATLQAQDYRLAITPPLRQAVTADQRIEFARPKCVMKFPTGFILKHEIEAPWISRPTYEFTEAF